jgi:hypothetical protein
MSTRFAAGRLVHRALFPDTFVVQGGRLSPAAFMPRARDEGRLSMFDGEAVTAREVAQVFRLSTGAATAPVEAWQAFEVPVEASPTARNPAHCHADYCLATVPWLVVAKAVAGRAVLTSR